MPKGTGKYASMPAEKKAELNAKKRENYHWRKPERKVERENSANFCIHV